ncbi:HipA domain-containing protein [Pantoea sp. A4]|uniref:HipA domain-containing protein n=1 Tax=Pantoea sp. A4 TaxID=1225184 RepID=UPI00037FB486|nr:HipA domain-containing protein [Pantoea sp. A4]
MQEKRLAFERAVFNVVFNNRDDHPKNFSYFMSSTGKWKLAPAYDVTFCEGPGGYHQMDVMGEALNIERKHILKLAEEAEVSSSEADEIINDICNVGTRFFDIAKEAYPDAITDGTLKFIQSRISQNIQNLR